MLVVATYWDAQDGKILHPNTSFLPSISQGAAPCFPWSYSEKGINLHPSGGMQVGVHEGCFGPWGVTAEIQALSRNKLPAGGTLVR